MPGLAVILMANYTYGGGVGGGGVVVVVVVGWLISKLNNPDSERTSALYCI